MSIFAQSKLSLPQDYITSFNIKLQTLLSKTAFCDVELNIENTIIKSNKTILSLYSDYFKHLFIHHSKVPSAPINLPDFIALSTFSIINEWLSKQLLSSELETITLLQVFQAADFLGMNNLIYQSLNIIMIKLSVDNCLLILQTILPLYIQQMPLSIIHEQAINTLFQKSKEIESDFNPLSKALRMLFTYIKGNLYEIIITKNKNDLKGLDCIDHNNLIPLIESFIFKIKTKTELERIYSFIGKALKRDHFDLFIFISQRAQEICKTQTEFVYMPKFNTIPIVSFTISLLPYLSEQSSFDLHLKKKIKSQRRDWSIELHNDHEGNIELSLSHYKPDYSSHVGVVSIIYAILVESTDSENNQIFKQGNIVSHLKYQRTPIDIFIATYNELMLFAKESLSGQVKVSIWIGEIPLFCSALAFFTDNFLELMYRDEQTINESIYKLKIDDVYNILQLPSIMIEREEQMLLFVMNYFKGKPMNHEEEMIKLLSCVRLKFINNKPLMKIYNDDYHNQSQSLLVNYPKVNEIFIKEFHKRIMHDLNLFGIHPNLSYEEKSMISRGENSLMKNINPRTCYKYPVHKEENYFTKELQNFITSNNIDMIINEERMTLNPNRLLESEAVRHLDSFVDKIEDCLKYMKKEEGNIQQSFIPRLHHKSLSQVKLKEVKDNHTNVINRLELLIDDIHDLKDYLE